MNRFKLIEKSNVNPSPFPWRIFTDGDKYFFTCEDDPLYAIENDDIEYFDSLEEARNSANECLHKIESFMHHPSVGCVVIRSVNGVISFDYLIERIKKNDYTNEEINATFPLFLSGKRDAEEREVISKLFNAFTTIERGLSYIDSFGNFFKATQKQIDDLKSVFLLSRKKS